MQYTAVEFGRIKTKFPFMYCDSTNTINIKIVVSSVRSPVTRKVTSEA